jgi:hypothetical protein
MYLLQSSNQRYTNDNVNWQQLGTNSKATSKQILPGDEFLSTIVQYTEYWLLSAVLIRQQQQRRYQHGNGTNGISSGQKSQG